MRVLSRSCSYGQEKEDYFYFAKSIMKYHRKSLEKCVCAQGNRSTDGPLPTAAVQLGYRLQSWLV